jgi:hypothetical protein
VVIPGTGAQVPPQLAGEAATNPVLLGQLANAIREGLAATPAHTDLLEFEAQGRELQCDPSAAGATRTAGLFTAGPAKCRPVARRRSPD